MLLRPKFENYSRDSNEDQTIRHRDDSAECFCQSRNTNGGGTDEGSASSLSGLLPSSKSVDAQVMLINFINAMEPFLKTRRRAEIHQEVGTHEFVHARFRAKCDTGLKTCKSR